jgi:hypothetical protein
MTRRSLLQGAGFVFAASQFSLLSRTGSAPRLHIAHEDHLLATESALGYSQVLATTTGKSLKGCSIVAGLRNLRDREGYFLADAVGEGRWLLIESGLSFATPSESAYHRRFMRELFGLQIGLHVASQDLKDLYVTYEWPVCCMVRHFGGATPIEADGNDVIARAGGMPIAVRKEIGKGGIIYIGTPLGPLLPSGDREAIQLARALAEASY